MEIRVSKIWIHLFQILVKFTHFSTFANVNAVMKQRPDVTFRNNRMSVT